jgi:hypothetical protein
MEWLGYPGSGNAPALGEDWWSHILRKEIYILNNFI